MWKITRTLHPRTLQNLFEPRLSPNSTRVFHFETATHCRQHLCTRFSVKYDDKDERRAGVCKATVTNLLPVDRFRYISASTSKRLEYFPSHVYYEKHSVQRIFKAARCKIESPTVSRSFLSNRSVSHRCSAISPIVKAFKRCTNAVTTCNDDNGRSCSSLPPPVSPACESIGPMDHRNSIPT